jgi:hypothetical protein
MRFALVVALLPLLAVPACSSSRSARTNQAAPSHDSDVITAEELGTITAPTLYDAVRRLRPGWLLRSQPTAVMRQNQAQLIVYIDDIRYGGIESLRQVHASAVAYARYYSPGSAEARFGPGHLLGAIEVKTLPH